VAAILEFNSHLLSRRFDWPPALIYATCAVQFVCALALLVRRFVPWAAAVLTATTLGAVYSHLKIGSPATALSAVIYTAIQVWVGVAAWRSQGAGGPLDALG
jgi:uncharacterized membrane protein YphA (DoxX/SURF4 family)